MAMSEDGWGISARAEATGSRAARRSKIDARERSLYMVFYSRMPARSFLRAGGWLGTVARLALHHRQEDSVDIFDDEQPDTDRSRPLAVIIFGADAEVVPAVAEGARRGIEVAVGLT